MAMPAVLPTFTTDQVRAFPRDGCRYELVNGFLIVTPQPSNPHQVVVGRLLVAIAGYLGEHGPAVAVSPGEIEVAPSHHLEPDLLVYPARFEEEADWTRIRDWWLAVEVSGRGSRRYDRDYKRLAYLTLGVQEVWLVDLEERSVLVSRPDGPREERYTERLRWHPPGMVAPLLLEIPRLFPGQP